jgi:predicted acyl esterase
VGLLGISYYAANQWLVAALRPPHLTAICPWEGFTDFYRDLNRHGGILIRFGQTWQDHQIFTVKHGVRERGRRNPTPASSWPAPDAERGRTRREPSGNDR